MMLRFNLSRAGTAVAAFVLSASAMAVSVIDPLVLTAATTDITDTATDVFTVVLPIVAAILAMVIGVKLFKRFASKV